MQKTIKIKIYWKQNAKKKYAMYIYIYIYNEFYIIYIYTYPYINHCINVLQFLPVA